MDDLKVPEPVEDADPADLLDTVEEPAPVKVEGPKPTGEIRDGKLILHKPETAKDDLLLKGEEIWWGKYSRG